VWEALPLEDQERFGETWAGYEQIFGAVYQKMVENDLNVSIERMQSYSTERWLKYVFNSTNTINRKAIYTSNQDLSVGVNLTSRYLLRFRTDGSNVFEIDVRGTNPASTTISEIINKINAAAGFAFANGVFENTVIQLVSQQLQPTGKIEILEPSDISKNATDIILGLEDTDLPKVYPKFSYSYILPYEKVVSIPSMQNRVRVESTGFMELIEGVDYAIETNNIISFLTPPSETVWAKRTLIDDETPWHNFGFLMGIYEKNKPSYLQVLQGLWYAYWTGPKPRNILTSLYLLFGLPVAPGDGVITRVTTTEIDITLLKDGSVRTFTIPSELTAIVSVGSSVLKYEPLVSGIEIFDKISTPGFITEEIGRSNIQRFLLDEASRGTGDTDETKALELLEEHTFLPQISVEAFISPEINLSNVKTFLNNIRPLSKTYLFQVIVGKFREKIDLQDYCGLAISIDVTPNLDSNQTTFAEQSVLDSYETVNNDALNLDSDVMGFRDSVEIDVLQNSTLIETFSV
jgi:hypothetical protein